MILSKQRETKAKRAKKKKHIFVSTLMANFYIEWKTEESEQKIEHCSLLAGLWIRIRIHFPSFIQIRKKEEKIEDKNARKLLIIVIL